MPLFSTAPTPVPRASLDALAAGIVLLDATQCITFKNRTAQALLVTGDPLVIRRSSQHGREIQSLALAPQYSNMRPQFERLLQTAGHARMRDEVDHFSDALIVADGVDGKPRCVIHAAPLVVPHDDPSTDLVPRVIVFIYDLQSVSVEQDHLESLFGLTAGESRAALQLLRGGSANEMADRLGVSINTFKTQIKGVYEKTMTHRQADLLKRLLALGSR
jgi:DNA-binding CsgD family transcriptional regulator